MRSIGQWLDTKARQALRRTGFPHRFACFLRNEWGRLRHPDQGESDSEVVVEANGDKTNVPTTETNQPPDFVETAATAGANGGHVVLVATESGMPNPAPDIMEAAAPAGANGSPIALAAAEAGEAAPTECEDASPSRPTYPFIMLNTVPKSGSVFLVEMFRQTLEIQFKAVSYGYVPHDLIDYFKIKEASAGNCISQEHFDAHPTNLQLLREFCPRFVLHVRDPRQATLSWIHHLKHHVSLGDLHLLSFVTPAPPASLFREEMGTLIDWHLENYLPHLLGWMEAWLELASTTTDLQILVTNYEDFCRDNSATVRTVLDFYGIDHVGVPAAVPKDGTTHFRKGKPDEWRSVYSLAQVDRCKVLMSGHKLVAARYMD